MSGKEIINIFGFNVQEEPVSIYPFSPVYRVKHGENDVIVKRTQRRAERTSLLGKPNCGGKELAPP